MASTIKGIITHPDFRPAAMLVAGILWRRPGLNKFQIRDYAPNMSQFGINHILNDFIRLGYLQECPQGCTYQVTRALTDYITANDWRQHLGTYGTKHLQLN